jgi:hypothetical protein
MMDGQQFLAYLFWFVVWMGWLAISFGVAIYHDMLGGIIMGGVGTIVWALLGLLSTTTEVKVEDQSSARQKNPVD